MTKVERIVSLVNKSLVWYKKGGYIDARRTPTSGVNMVDTLADFVEARFNRECYDLPELSELCEAMGGKCFTCSLVGPNEDKRRFDKATLTLISPEDVEEPTPELIELIKKAKEFFGGTKISFNCLKVKIKITVEQ